MQPDTRTLLRTGGTIFGAGVLCVLLLFTLMGGVTRQGPHSNAGWLVLIFALGCLPVGFFTSALGLAKLIGERTRSGSAQP